MSDPIGYDPHPFATGEIAELKAERDKAMRCDYCAQPRTLHPSGNFYECRACHQRRAVQIADLAAENSRMREIVNKLPKTADGVPIYPGMSLWFAFRDGVVSGNAWGGGSRIHAVFDEPIQLVSGMKDSETNESNPSLSACYATREAALAAQNGGAQ